jgi:hypothetical protein
MPRTRVCLDKPEVFFTFYLVQTIQIMIFNRSTQRGGLIRLSASKSFEATLSRSLKRLTGLINSKLDQSFEFSMYNWTPQKRESVPNMQLDELINWLTTVVDSLAIKEQYKDEAYKGAFEYIADTLMVGSTTRSECIYPYLKSTELPHGEGNRHDQRECNLQYPY